MSELKKCPFCGGEAQVNTWTMHGITESRCFCSNSDCPNSVRTVALEQWNTRPIEDALNARIAELEAAQTRWVMASERLPKVSGWYLTGLVYFLGSLYSSEVYFDAENIEPRWNNITSDKIYCWLEGVPELPQPPEVQE